MGVETINRLDELPSDDEIEVFARSLRPIHTVKGQTVPKSVVKLRAEARKKLVQRKARQVGARYSLYSLRHSWATNALKRGIDALTVAVLMGHKDPSTLARVYQHLSHSPKHLLDQAKRAAG